MRVLLLTQIVPYPPDSGPKVKTYHVLRYLAEHGYAVTLATFMRQDEAAQIEPLKPYCAEIHTVPMHRSRWADLRAYGQSLRSDPPFLVRRDALPPMQALVRRLTQAQDFDVVHADQLTMGQFLFDAHGGQRVFDAHNAVWTIVQRSQETASPVLRPLLAWEARRLKAYEGALCREVDAVLAVSEADRQALVEAGADSRKIHIIPIAVDSGRLQPVRAANEAPDPFNIMTMGTLFYPPNADGVRWFMHEVYPWVRQQLPQATLTVVGPRPPRDIVAFGKQHAPAVSVTGYVPDLGPYLRRAAVMVVPVRAASGMRVRILEALAQGLPVVTTTTGVEGIDAVHGEHLLIADEPAQFAAAVVQVLKNPQLGRTLAQQGRRLIEEKYDWRVALPKLEAVYGGQPQRAASLPAPVLYGWQPSGAGQGAPRRGGDGI